MAYERELFQKKLDRWENYMEHFRLPVWEELPDMSLYMDQVVVLVTRYLDLLPHDEANPVITPSTVNNYVRLRLVPAPEKKRYTRRHLACIIMICALKQSLTLQEIQLILPEDQSEDAIRVIYNDFVSKMSSTTLQFIDQVKSAAAQVLVPENKGGCENLVMHSAVSSVLYKLLTVKLTGLKGMTDGDTSLRFTEN